MSKESNDALRIPIEIKTEDIKELQGLIQEINDAKSDIRELKPLRGKSSSTSSRSPFTSNGGLEGGIFSGVRQGETMPSKSRNTTSRQAIQRDSEFSKLREQVNEVEERQNVLGKGLGVLTQATGFGSLLGAKGGSGIQNFVGGIAGKLFLPIAIATAVMELIQQGINLALGPGGPWDRRFKRDIKNEISSAAEREEKLQIRAGDRVIRLTASSTDRSMGSERNLQQKLAGRPQFSQLLSGRSKGLFP
mgnify:CR=1 FL=1